MYEVWSARPIESASLSFEATAVGAGALANVVEEYSTVGGSFIMNLVVVETPVFSQDFDSGAFGPLNYLRADKDIQISELGDSQIFSVTQTYGPSVPEPTAAVLFGLGSGIVGIAIRRRSVV